jgi:type III pantothenate kinase
MILTVEIGNTNIVCGVYDKDKLASTFRMATKDIKTEDEYAIIIIQCIEESKLDIKKIDGMIVSSDVPALNFTFTRLGRKYFDVDPIFVDQNIKSGISIKIETPKQLGPDLLVGAVAANQKFPDQNNLIIDLGTATTMTIVTKKKEFLGGTIYPGMRSSLVGLAQHAGALPYVELDTPDTVIGKDTITSMQAGMMHGYAAMIDGMIKKFKAEFKDDLNVILTGGYAVKVCNLITEKATLDSNLLLDGLKYLYDKNN